MENKLLSSSIMIDTHTHKMYFTVKFIKIYKQTAQHASIVLTAHTLQHSCRDFCSVFCSNTYLTPKVECLPPLKL